MMNLVIQVTVVWFIHDIHAVTLCCIVIIRNICMKTSICFRDLLVNSVNLTLHINVVLNKKIYLAGPKYVIVLLVDRMNYFKVLVKILG